MSRSLVFLALRRHVGLAAGLVVLAACSGPPGAGGADAGPPPFDRRALLRHLAAGLIAPATAQVATDTAALATAVDGHCAALAQGDAAATAASARAAWATAIDTWERLDAVQVGPVAADAARLRNRIYAWPLLAPCTIDQDVVARWADPAAYDVTTRLDNARSLAAVEYLLFYGDPRSSCPLPPAGWDGLGADLPRARCGLAAAIAADVRDHAAQLATAWRPDGGDYVTQLAAAGTAASAIVGEREAVNMVSDGLFYVDRLVKDMKLGEAAGIVINACGTIEAPCLREVEHRFADRGTPALQHNLAALRAAFTGVHDGGGDGPGFDDYLIAVGAPELAARMTANLDAAIAAAAALPASYTAALTTERARVVAVHAAVKLVTDDLKSQFLTVLGLDLPDDVAGDND